MKWLALLLATSTVVAASEPVPSPAQPNQVAGTWRMVAATLEANGKIERPYGENPQGRVLRRFKTPLDTLFQSKNPLQVNDLPIKHILVS